MSECAQSRVWLSQTNGVYHTRRLCRGTLFPIDKAVSIVTAENRGYEPCGHCENDPTGRPVPDGGVRDLRTNDGADPETKSKENRRPWEYPDCPECESHAFVGEWNRGNPKDTSVIMAYYCYLCELAFDPEDGWKAEI